MVGQDVESSGSALIWFCSQWLLALYSWRSNVSTMLTNEISSAALELSPEDRLELARRLVESVVEPATLKQAVVDGIWRIEDVASGKVAWLTEE